MDQDDSTTKKSSKKNKVKKGKPILSDDGSSSSDLVIVEDPTTIQGSSKSQLKPSTSKTNLNNNNSTATGKKRKKRDSASSDEERWLTAIESGKLEDVDDELKKIKPKDPALMTARQRAMYDRGTDGNLTTPTLMSLPTGYKEKVMTAEAIQKAQIKSQKRKQMADEKREKDKKKTMERLLKKQDSKAVKQAKSKTTRTNIVPVIIYKQNINSTTITYPDGVEFPLQRKLAIKPKPVVYCCMGCGNMKKYSCSRTGAPLCSLQCYKNNISSRIL